MAIKKYTSGAWVPTTYRRYGTETDTITSLPAQIIGDGQPITSCQIFGNTVQDGTPTPEAPVDVQGVGERTGNLFDGYLELGSINSNDGTDFQSTIRCRTNYIGVIQNKAYAVSAPIDCIVRFVAFYGENKEFLGYSSNSSNTYTFDTPSSTKAIRIVYGYKDNSSIIVSEFPSDKIMINLGSATLPWEPHGYKIQISCGGTTTNVYLGETQSTRKIKKLVFDGTEDWTYSVSNNKKRVYVRSFDRAGAPLACCSHFTNTDFNLYPDAGYFIINTISTTQSIIFGISDMQVSDASDWTQYLAQQYSAGSPVTVWYVLETPEAKILNEPICKIGGYADTVSATNIPTTGTPENFDVGTTLKPSEVQLTYHGWHEHDDTKYTQGE